METQERPRSSIFRDIALAHREIYALYDIALVLGSSLGLSDVMAHLSSGLRNMMPVSCALYLQQEDDVLRCTFATGVEAGEIQKLAMRVGEGLAGWVARHRRSLINAPPAIDFAAARSSSQTTLKSALVHPLIVNDRLVGILSLYDTAQTSYTEDHLRLLAHVSDQAAVVIDNSLTFERAQEDALRDAITRLPNARYMHMHAARELARAERLHNDGATWPELLDVAYDRMRGEKGQPPVSG